MVVVELPKGLSPEAVESKLEDLPGVRVVANTLRGSFDAVNAALTRLGQDTLKIQTAYPHAVPVKTDGFPLRDYQVRGVRWLSRHLRATGAALLADDTGLGKTLQSVVLMQRLALDEGGRVLVICPKPAMLTWQDELKKWSKASAVIVPATASERLWKQAQEAAVVVCSYDHRVLDRTVNRAFSEGWPKMVVLDEFHRARGRKSLRSRKLREILPLATYRLALTATPQYDRPRDLWQQLSLLWPKAWGTQYEFDLAYCGGMNVWGQSNKGVKRPEELRARIGSLMLRRTKAEVAKELPPLVRQVRWVDPTPEAVRAYSAAVSGFGRASFHMALLATLKGKMDEAIELAVEARQFLLLTWMREHAHQMARMLSVEHDTPAVVITGDMSIQQRREAIEDARANRKGLVATLDSTAESLNLQGLASTGIMHYIPFEPNKIAQAEGRLHRLGVVESVVWNYIVMRDSADMAVLSAVVNKMDQWTQTIDSSRRELRHALGDAVDGEGAAANDQKVLAALYREMKS